MSARVICGSIYFARHAVQRSSADANNAQTLSHSCVSADLLLNDKIKMSFTLWIGARPFDTHTLCLSAHAYRSANLRCASFGVCFRFVSAPNGTQMHRISNRIFLPSAIHCVRSVPYRQCWWMRRQDVNWIISNIIYVTPCARTHSMHVVSIFFFFFLLHSAIGAVQILPPTHKRKLFTVFSLHFAKHSNDRTWTKEMNNAKSLVHSHGLQLMMSQFTAQSEGATHSKRNVNAEFADRSWRVGDPLPHIIWDHYGSDVVIRIVPNSLWMVKWNAARHRNAKISQFKIKWTHICWSLSFGHLATI